MAAVFYSYGGSDIFYGKLEFKSPVNAAFMDGFLGKDNLSIITEMSVETSETTQFFLSFDDLISFLHFGKGMGNINITGLMFCDCNGNIPGASAFYNMIGKIRGTAVSVSVGGTVFSGVLASSTASIMAEPDTMMQFGIQLVMVDHSMPKKQKSSGGGSSGSQIGGGANFSAGKVRPISAGFSSSSSNKIGGGANFSAGAKGTDGLRTPSQNNRDLLGPLNSALPDNRVTSYGPKTPQFGLNQTVTNVQNKILAEAAKASEARPALTFPSVPRPGPIFPTP